MINIVLKILIIFLAVTVFEAIIVAIRILKIGMSDNYPIGYTEKCKGMFFSNLTIVKNDIRSIKLTDKNDL